MFQKYQKALKISQFVNQQSSKTEQSGGGSHKIFDDDVNGTHNDVNSFR